MTSKILKLGRGTKMNFTQLFLLVSISLLIILGAFVGWSLLLTYVSFFTGFVAFYRADSLVGDF